MAKLGTVLEFVVVGLGTGKPAAGAFSGPSRVGGVAHRARSIPGDVQAACAGMINLAGILCGFSLD